MSESGQDARIRDLERRLHAAEMQIGLLRGFIARLAAPAADIAAVDAQHRHVTPRDLLFPTPHQE